MDEEIQIDFVKTDDGRTVATLIDIIDFMLLCYKGKQKDVAFFTRLLKTTEEVNEEWQKN